VRFDRKEIAMKKRIAGTLVMLALAGAATIASAADTPFPSSVPEEYSLSQEFPNMTTYQDEHRNSIAQQAPANYPAEALQEYPLSGEFPNMVTYKQEHHNSAIAQAPMTYPSSVPEEYSLASEFPNATTYADLHSDQAVAQTNPASDQASSGQSVASAR
jgi:hypothetical protein